MDQWQHIAGLAAAWAGTVGIGWVGQHVLKSRTAIDTSLAHAVMFGVAFACYAIQNHNIVDPTAWIMAGFAWAAAAIGTGSVLAGAGLAAKTDSR